MSLEWIRENPSYWDPRKAEIIDKTPAGIFHFEDYQEGDILPGEWWRVEDGGSVLGYGWMDTTWGDAEILLVVAPDGQNRGVGTFILDQLEKEARVEGLNYLYNEVRATHPDPEGITNWLRHRRFEPSHDDRLLRRSVRR
jgi:GNAT superfamily N-acetyltransferase